MLVIDQVSRVVVIGPGLSPGKARRRLLVRVSGCKTDRSRALEFRRITSNARDLFRRGLFRVPAGHREPPPHRRAESGSRKRASPAAASGQAAGAHCRLDPMTT